MLFVYIHTHSPERCLGSGPEVREMMAGLYQAAEKAGVKILSNYAAAQEHKFILTLEIPDTDALAAMMRDPTSARWSAWGDAQLIPVFPVRAGVPAEPAKT